MKKIKPQGQKTDSWLAGTECGEEGTDLGISSPNSNADTSERHSEGQVPRVSKARVESSENNNGIPMTWVLFLTPLLGCL